jgi:hypothetical protein
VKVKALANEVAPDTVKSLVIVALLPTVKLVPILTALLNVEFAPTFNPLGKAEGLSKYKTI